MEAGIYQGNGVLQIRERPDPQLAQADPDWVKIKVEACGVCGTDLQILKVPPGHPAEPDTVLGHEFVGRVEEVGAEAENFQVGDRVTVAPNLTCRELNLPLCPLCRRGHSNHCDHWTTIGLHRDGAFAPYVLAPEKALFPVAEHLDVRNAIWIEPLSCVLGGFHRLDAQAGQLGVVIGAGPIGILHGLMLKSAGLQVLISDLSAFRLAKAQEAGLDRTVNVRQESFQEVVMDMSQDRGADIIIDAVGGQLGTAVDSAAMMGQICCFGINAVRPEVHEARITERELTIFGTFVGLNTFPRAIELLEQGTLQPASLNQEFLPIQDLPQGLETCRQGEAVKVAVSFH